MVAATQRTIVVGTAGHVDHGKSALVRALTGVNPDRLPQEKQRGMTIDLGFANLQLPSGSIVSFVDVPGHERFVATMVAGATGVDAGLLVVAADEGVMPQTREHIAILDLLGVSPCLVALTKADLADRTMLDIAGDEIREAVRGTTLEGADVLAVSALTGAGLVGLISRLDRIADTVGPDVGSVSRLVVDRAFTVTGFGTVVTGPLSGPGFSAGDEAAVHPGARRVRIRGLQRSGQDLVSAGHGRTALNLAGANRVSIARGEVIAHPDEMVDCFRFDGRLTLLTHAITLHRNATVSVHAGAASISARVFPLESEYVAAGETAWVQLRMDSPVAVWRGQHFIVRRPSPSRTIGGGVIADIAPARRARDRDFARLATMLSDDLSEVVFATLQARPLTLRQLAARCGLSRQLTSTLLRYLVDRGDAAQIGTRFLDRRADAALRSTAESHLGERAESSPADPFLPREELRRALGLKPAEMSDLVTRMAGEATVVTDQAGARIALSCTVSAEHGIDASDEAGPAARILNRLDASGFRPASIQEIVRLCQADDTSLRRLESTGQVVRLDSWLYLTKRGLDGMIAQVCALLEAQGSITVSQLRQELDTSRKYALVYAEYLDGHRVTRRTGDLRVPGKNFDQVRRQLAHSG